MPELPEVETTLCGIRPHITGQKIKNSIVRHHGLRWPIDADINQRLKNNIITSAERRGKYLLLRTPSGTIILHLGMSGSLRVLTNATKPEKHDHVDIELFNQKILRLNDPRRFGAFIWTEQDPLTHPLLKDLGPEPLTDDFSGTFLWQRAQGRKVAVKAFIMNNKVVVGVGNIYAAEALFCAGIHPEKPAYKIDIEKYKRLVTCIKKILRQAIKQGGTTLKNFVDSDGKPGYFSMRLKVYGRAGLPCVNCKTELKEMTIGQRSTVYCPTCQILNN